VVQVGTELLEALRATDPDMPPAMVVFDRVVASGEPRPDFYEYSVRFGERFSPHRLTFYFDVHRRGPQVAREAGARFVRLVGELGLSIPPRLRAFVLSDASSGDEVLQVVLGIEVPRDGTSARAKYYLVFRDNPGRRVRELMGALELAPAGGADPDRVYIVGCDLTDAGVEDIKLYFRLELGRVAALLEDPGQVRDLLAASRDVVFQQCSRRPARRQLYLHARSGEFLQRWLVAHGFEEVLGRVRTANVHLGASRLEPWIVSFAYDRRRLDLSACNVYFHLVRAS
jgi:hypothetical protein